ncbi:DUF2442 domain-containing protein [Mycoplana dimorpha]|uniref:Uncharacterized protein DUF2442 n=1 Tax=Mycoplana dimorpha TaxID=28320 RepID=A0A2T5ANR9_MYCDI|nr:DUF2442 domain-containing protein [Mycoplana dimorpha]PTM88373.1 uncharacterized protein DUF2442 [Mycoplana dimorpha]
MRESTSAASGSDFTEISEAEFEAATAAGEKTLEGPIAAGARYDAGRKSLIVDMPDGTFIGLPVRKLEGLQGATDEQLENVVIEARGLGLHWPELDADLYVPALIEGVFGSRRWMAAQMGAAGGKAKSISKIAAARLNGRRGGRPKKNKDAA